MLSSKIKNLFANATALNRVVGTPFLRYFQENISGIIFYIMLGMLAILSVVSTLTPLVGGFYALCVSIFCTVCAITCEFTDLSVVNDSVVKQSNDSKKPSFSVRCMQFMIEKMGLLKWLLVAASGIVIFQRYDRSFAAVFGQFIGLIWGQRVARIGALSAAAYDLIVNFINVEKATLQTTNNASFFEVGLSQQNFEFDQNCSIDDSTLNGIKNDIELAHSYGLVGDSTFVFNVWKENHTCYKCVAIKDKPKPDDTSANLSKPPYDYRILCMMIFFGTLLYVCGEFAILSSIARPLISAHHNMAPVIHATVLLSMLVAVIYQAILWSFNFLYVYKDYADSKLQFLKQWLYWTPDSRMSLLVGRQTLMCLTQDVARSVLSGDLSLTTVLSIASLPLRINAGEAQASTELKMNDKDHYDR